MTSGKWPNGLAEAMKRKGVGPTALSRAVGTSKQNIDRWAKQQRELTASWAMKLAPHLDTTAAALLLLPDGDAPPPSVASQLSEVMELTARLTVEEQADLVAFLLRQRGFSIPAASQPAPKERTAAKSK